MRYLLLFSLCLMAACTDLPAALSVDPLLFHFCWPEGTPSATPDDPESRVYVGTVSITGLRVELGSVTLVSATDGLALDASVTDSAGTLDVYATKPLPSSSTLQFRLFFETDGFFGDHDQSETFDVRVLCGDVEPPPPPSPFPGVGPPQVAMNGSGDAVVVYRVDDEIRAQRFLDSGGWQAERTLFIGGPSDPSGDLDVAMDTERAMVVWEQETNVVRSIELNVLTDVLAPAVQLDDAFFGVHAPRAAATPFGTTFKLGAWLEEVVAGTSGIPQLGLFAAMPGLNPDRVDDEQNPPQSVGAFDLAVDQFDRGLAVWAHPDISRHRILAARFAGGAWTEPVEIDSDPDAGTGAPSLALDASANGIVAYRRAGVVHAKRYDGATNQWSVAEALGDGLRMDARPTAVANAAGQVLVAWPTDTDTRARLYTPGTGWSPLHLFDSQSRRVFPGLDGDGNMRVVGDDGTLVWTASRRAGGDWSSRETIGNGQLGDFAMDASGRGVAAWLSGAVIATRVFELPPSDGNVVFATYRDGQLEIYKQIDGVDTPLTDDPASDTSPAWSPDRAAVAFVSDRDHPGTGLFELYVIDLDGANETRMTGVTDDGGFTVSDPAWSPDGQTITFVLSRPQAPPAIYSVPAGGGLPDLLLERPGATSIASPTWGPDGIRIAYEEDAEILLFDVTVAIPIPQRLVEGSDPDWFGSAIVFTHGGNLCQYDVDTQVETTLLATADADVAPAYSVDGTEIYFVRQTFEPRVMRLAAGRVEELPGQAAGGTSPDG